jgi:uncharacterized protein YkwD
MISLQRVAANGGFRHAAAIGGLLALAACGSVHPTGEGRSLSAGTHLAGIRSENGLPTLTSDPVLEQAALQQAGYMAQTGKMTHTTRLGRDFASRVRGYQIEGAAAENIASGQKDLGDLFKAWMNSSGHRRNMLDPRFSRYGLAYVTDGNSNRRYWALVLAR